MPFKRISKFAKKDVLEELPGVQTRKDVSDIVFDVIKQRASCRSYQHKDIPNKLILKLLEAAGTAPSAGNHQPWEFIVIKNNECREALAEAAYNQKWMLDAPVFIVVCINAKLAAAVYGERGLRLYGIQDVAAATENLLIAAEAYGLGTCWVGAFAEPKVKILTRCPDFIRPCAIITLGYKAKKTVKPMRQSMDEYVHIERFGKTVQDLRIEKEKKPKHIKLY